MRLWTRLLVYAATGAFALCSFEATVSPAFAQQAAQEPTGQSSQQSPADQAAQQPAAPSSPESGSSQAAQPASSTDALPQAPEPQTAQPPQKPVGTAAAETPNVSGVAASQPAGIAIAPAKQRRVRTLVLKIGALAGAGVALGTVVALTRGTPSKPPGAH